MQMLMMHLQPHLCDCQRSWTRQSLLRKVQHLLTANQAKANALLAVYQQNDQKSTIIVIALATIAVGK